MDTGLTDARGNTIMDSDILILQFPEHDPEAKELNGRQVAIREVITAGRNGTFWPKGMDAVTRHRFTKGRKLGIHIPSSWTRIMD